MTRPSIIAFLSLAFVGGTFGAPREAVTVGNIHARVDVDSGRCGTWIFASQSPTVKLNGGVAQRAFIVSRP